MLVRFGFSKFALLIYSESKYFEDNINANDYVDSNKKNVHDKCELSEMQKKKWTY